MQLFSNAEYIISEVGAALTNMLFAKPGCVIISLAPDYHNANHYYYSNLAGILGHTLYTVRGNVIQSTQPVGCDAENLDYRIDEKVFQYAGSLCINPFSLNQATGNQALIQSSIEVIAHGTTQPM